jgi:hypothetical protein
LIDMKTLKIVAVLTLAVIASTLLTASAYAYMGGRIGTPYAANFVQTGTSNGGYNGGMMGRSGMMGGYGYYNPALVNTVPQQPGTPSTTTPTTPTNQYPIGGWGCGGMRSNIGYSAPIGTTATSTEPLNITSAVTIAKDYLTSTGNTNLVLSQVEEYTQNFYVQVKEKDTGNGAFELLINKFTGTIFPEMGPKMMWNTKYGMMSTGMMGYFNAVTTTTATPISATQAAATAQQYLNTTLHGTTVGDVTTFYGYYTIEVRNGATTYGMLSVNSYTGQVWYHTWHGAFIQELTLN